MKISDGFKLAIGFVIGKAILTGTLTGFLRFVVKQDWEDQNMRAVKSAILKDEELCRILNVKPDKKPKTNTKKVVVQGFKG